MCIYGNFVRIVHIQNRMSIDCFCPLFKILANFCFGLKQNAFLRQWISPHQQCKYTHFFTINAPLEYYFFLYKVFSILYGGEKKKDDFSSPHQCSFTKLFLQSHNSRDTDAFNLGDISYRISSLK